MLFYYKFGSIRNIFINWPNLLTNKRIIIHWIYYCEHILSYWRSFVTTVRGELYWISCYFQSIMIFCIQLVSAYNWIHFVLRILSRFLILSCFNIRSKPKETRINRYKCQKESMDFDKKMPQTSISESIQFSVHFRMTISIRSYFFVQNHQ